jgi:hypothetical protein
MDNLTCSSDSVDMNSHSTHGLNLGKAWGTCMADIRSHGIEKERIIRWNEIFSRAQNSDWSNCMAQIRSCDGQVKAEILRRDIPQLRANSISVEDNGLNGRCIVCFGECEVAWSECPSKFVFASTTSLVGNNSCKNGLCSSCLTGYLKCKIESAEVSPQRSIKCPCGNKFCSGEIVEDVIRTILSTDDRLLSKLAYFAQEALIAQDPHKVWCPAPNCKSIASVNQTFPRRATCDKCELAFCTKCKNAHSIFITCEMAGDYEFNHWRRTRKEGCKKCPHCRIYIEKNEGCMHMTCYSCRHEFCWTCLAPWRGGCSAPRPYHAGKEILDSKVWGEWMTTRIATQTVGVPVCLAVASGVGGAALGCAAAGAAIASGVLVATSPVIGAVYLYHNPPRFMRKITRSNSSFSPAESYNGVLRVIVHCHWQADDPNYLSALEEGSNVQFMGLRGRREGSIFVGYMSQSGMSPSILYLVPRNTPAQDVINTIGILQEDTDDIRVAFPGISVPYAPPSSDNDVLIGQLVGRIQSQMGIVG